MKRLSVKNSHVGWLTCAVVEGYLDGFMLGFTLTLAKFIWFLITGTLSILLAQPDVASARWSKKLSPRQETIQFQLTGLASYYGAKFHAKRTASGERFDNNSLTAVHKTLPFGSRLKVINPRNGLSVIVRINDRGPFVKGRIIDLSKAAARKVGLSHQGTLPVRLEILR
jgi:rare lipoprotein A (peptidoglycan hydrolase)